MSRPTDHVSSPSPLPQSQYTSNICHLAEFSEKSEGSLSLFFKHDMILQSLRKVLFNIDDLILIKLPLHFVMCDLFSGVIPIPGSLVALIPAYCAPISGWLLFVPLYSTSL